jgi:hypothetical protein
MLKGSNCDCGGARIAGAGFDHRNIPSLELALEKAGATDGLNVAFPDLPQDRARLDLKGGDDDSSGGWALWRAASSVGMGIRLSI